MDPCDQEFEVDRDAGKMDISMGKAHVVVVVIFPPDVQKMRRERLANKCSLEEPVRDHPQSLSFVFPSDMNNGCVRLAQSIT